jgi:PD-(D/E)XK nuclease family transposase
VSFADLKNDFVFRRVFAAHRDILRALLNDLLEREGEHVIESLEYLPSEQVPIVAGAKLSILDVKCRERSGTTFVVEMQLIHMPGFLKRVVYNASKAYVGQLEKGKPYTDLRDVVAISICDFALWPDAEQDEMQQPRVPMLSRWNMTERSSKNHGLLHIQYAFLELTKLPPRRPATGAELWAWLFVHAPELTEVPPELPPGPHRDAVELCNVATFTLEELDAYQKVINEIEQMRELVAAKLAEGEARGDAAGFTRGERAGVVKTRIADIFAILATRGIAVDSEARARIEGCTDVATLERWFVRAVTAASAAEVVTAT